MKPSRPSIIIGFAVVAAVVAWSIVRFTYASLPLLPWTAMPTLVVLAFAEAYIGMGTKARIQHRSGARPIEPLVAARLAALGKASSHTAAALGGVALGLTIYLAGSLDKPTPRSDFFVSLGTTIACALLVAAALYLEQACRIPKGPTRAERPDDREWDPSDHA